MYIGGEMHAYFSAMLKVSLHAVRWLLDNGDII